MYPSFVHHWSSLYVKQWSNFTFTASQLLSFCIVIQTWTDLQHLLSPSQVTTGDITELMGKTTYIGFLITWALVQKWGTNGLRHLFDPCLSFSAAEILCSNSALADFTCAEWSHMESFKKKHGAADHHYATTLAPPAPLYQDRCAQWDALPLVASMQSSLCISHAPVAMAGWSFDWQPEHAWAVQFQSISLNFIIEPISILFDG